MSDIAVACRHVYHVKDGQRGSVPFFVNGRRRELNKIKKMNNEGEGSVDLFIPSSVVARIWEESRRGNCA